VVAVVATHQVQVALVEQERQTKAMQVVTVLMQAKVFRAVAVAVLVLLERTQLLEVVLLAVQV
jgi:hypothetical protein